MKILIILLSWIPSLFAFAQQKKPLIEGEPLPVWFQSITASNAGQFLILDLFTSSCPACFNNLPKVNDMQKKFEGKIRFIAVGKLDRKVAAVYKRFEQQFGLKLEVLYDSLIFEKSDIRSVPKYLWIDNKGILKAVTGPKELTSANMLQFIKGLPILVQREPDFEFDPSLPFLQASNGGDSQDFLFRSLITQWDPSMPQSLPLLVQHPGNDSSFQVLGATIEQLYKYAYMGRESWRFGDSLFGKVERTVKFMDKPDETKYCYSLIIRGRQNRSIQSILRNELDHYFGYKIELKKAVIQGYELIIDSSAFADLRTTNGKRSINRSSGGVELKASPISDLLRTLSYYTDQKIVFIDSTGIDYPIDLELNCILSNIDMVQKELSKYGLFLRKTCIPVEQLVLHSPDNHVAAK